jgi:hypothetical protein
MTSNALKNALALFKQSASGDPGAVGFYADASPAGNIIRMRDRVFFGDGAIHTGNLSAPFGSTQLATAIANWPEKNAQVIAESTLGKIGILGVSCLITGQTSGSSIGVAGFAQAALAGGTSRALYGDATLESGATAVYGLELATANRGTDTTANPYTASAGAYGLKIAHESASGYLLGDSNTPATDSTAPGTAAIIIQAGPGGTSNHQYRTGLLIYSNSLYGSDGTNGTAEAIAMGKGHALNWYAGSSILGATVRSDVTAVSGHDVGIVFSNDTISFQATASASSVPMLNLLRDTVSAGGVNYLTLSNARTNTNPTFQAAGSDANIGIAIKGKGTGVQQFFTNGGEAFRVGGSVANPVNFLQAAGQVANSNPRLSALGSDTNLDVEVFGKGAGGARLLAGDGTTKVQVNTTGVGLNGATPVGKVTGFGTPTGTGVIANFPGATATLAQCSQAVAQLIADLKNLGVYGA